MTTQCDNPFAGDAGLEAVLTEHEPLAAHTWFGLGGPARWMARPRDADQLTELTRRCARAGLPLRVLGQGANLLVGDDGVDGVVVRLDHQAFKRIEWPAPEGPQGQEVTVRAGAGADLGRLTLEAVRRGLAGLECMAGIPGTVGGAVRMNAGGRFGCIADVIRAVRVMHRDGRQAVVAREQAGFAYRRSGLEDVLILEAELALRRDDPARLHERYREVWEAKRRTQPLRENSAGCVFKNPPGHSAGSLIDRAGLKGRKVGGAWVAREHANFIVAREGATAADVLELIGQIRSEVSGRFGVDLELEIELWGCRSPQEAAAGSGGSGTA